MSTVPPHSIFQPANGYSRRRGKPTICLYRGPRVPEYVTTDEGRARRLAHLPVNRESDELPVEWSVVESLTDRPKTVAEMSDEALLPQEQIRDLLYEMEALGIVVPTVPMPQTDGSVCELWVLR